MQEYISYAVAVDRHRMLQQEADTQRNFSNIRMPTPSAWHRMKLWARRAMDAIGRFYVNTAGIGTKLN